VNPLDSLTVVVIAVILTTPSTCDSQSKLKVCL
jgi:hypothetical protein